MNSTQSPKRHLWGVAASLVVLVALVIMWVMVVFESPGTNSPTPYSVEQSQPTQQSEGIYVDRYLFTNNSDDPVTPSSVISVQGTLVSCESNGIVDPTTVSESQSVQPGASVRLLFCSTDGITVTIED